MIPPTLPPRLSARYAPRMAGFVSYLRVSTARQGASGLGLEAQRASIAAHVPNPDELHAEYIEVESGKRDDNRPELAKALAECRLRKATLIVAKLDRLSRDAAFLLTLQNSGAPFIAADMPGANNLTVGIMALVAQQEREMISKRTKEALQAAKARGKTLGGYRGHQADWTAQAKLGGAAKAKIANDRANDLKGVIAEARADGASTPTQIAEALNRRGIPTSNGGQWQAIQIKRVLDRLKP